MKITELEYPVKEGDILIVDALSEFHSELVHHVTIRVRFVRFEDNGKQVVLSRGILVKTVPTERIKVKCRFTPNPHRKNGNHN